MISLEEWNSLEIGDKVVVVDKFDYEGLENDLMEEFLGSVITIDSITHLSNFSRGYQSLIECCKSNKIIQCCEARWYFSRNCIDRIYKPLQLECNKNSNNIDILFK